MIAKKVQLSASLQDVIDALLEEMLDAGIDSEQYPKMLDQLTKLYKLKEIETPKRVSKDTWILVAGNLVGIILILTHERANVITSKALGFVQRLR